MAVKSILGGSRSRKKLVQIDAAEVHGEPGTGYEDPGDLGEFECENCEYFDRKSSSCGQKTMMKKSRRPRLPNGRVKVNPEGCCEYVERVGRKDEDKD